MEFPDYLSNEIRTRGISLKHLGVSDLAWLADDAIQLLSNAQRESIAVLGGDVCVNQKGNWNFNYDSWFCEKKSSEEMKDYIERSIREAFSYIQSYPVKERVAFVLVFKEKK